MIIVRCEALYDWNNVYNGRILYTICSKDPPDNNGNPEITDLKYRPPDFNDEILIDSNLNNLQETQKKNWLNNYNFKEFYYINFDDNMYIRPYVNTYTPLLNQYMLEDLMISL